MCGGPGRGAFERTLEARMKMMHNREDLLKQLESALSVAGANPSRWPKDGRARLAAFVETDGEAERLFVEAKALDRVLACASPGRAAGCCTARILAACMELPQERGGGSAAILPFGRTSRGRRYRGLRSDMPGGGAAFWGGAAMLAASLMLGIYIGVSGEAVPTIRSIELLASTDDMDAGIVFSGAVFEPREFEEREPL
jgi:hypothetical protein